MRKEALAWCAALALLAALVAPAWSQRANPCGVYTDSVTPSCTGTGWYSGVTSCAHRTIENCSGGGVTITDLGITFGYTNPTPSKGTIVFFGPEGGTSPSDPYYDEANYAAYYAGLGYQVVQTQWDHGSGSDANSDWEDTGSNTKNIAYAAGRPAAFLNWVRYGSTTGGPGLWTANGMCAQGNSGGGGAIAYILAWYSGGSYIDHAEFLSSPPFGNIGAGCAVNVGANMEVTVCASGQFGCNPSNNPASWTLTPYYTDLAGIREWSDDSTQGLSGVCRHPPVDGNTSTTANNEWNAMSIVDGTVGTFSYPETSMTAWLCSSNGVSPYNMNNSSTQADLFFQQFTNASQVYPNGFLINGVVNCNGVEDVTNANPSQFDNIKKSMVNQCAPHPH